MKILFIAYDNDSYISVFPLGLAYLAAVCKKAGHEVNIYNQDVYHWQEEHLFELLNNEHFDVIGIGVVAGYYQYRKLLKLSDVINKVKSKPYYILGGHGPSPEPEYFLNKTNADVIVIGEGEITIIELLEALEGKKELSSVKGIAYLKNGKCIQTPKRALIHDIDNLPFPAWDLFPMDHYALLREANIKNRERCMLVLSGRGCTFKCNFCYRMMEGYRPRSSESIIEEIQILQKDYAISYIDFQDELLMTSIPRIVDLCKRFINSGLKFKWFCNGRLNYAKQDVLKLMKEAGCVFINYGIESLDEKALRTMGKALTVKQIIAGIENTIAVGISPGLNIIFGNIGETQESLKLGVDFLLTYDDGAQLRTIRPVTPYPGTLLFKESEENKWFRINKEDWQKYDMKEPVLKTPMKPEEVMSMCDSMWRIYLDPVFVTKSVTSIRSWKEFRLLLKGVSPVLGHIKDFR